MMHVRVFCEEITDIEDIYKYLSMVPMSDRKRNETILEIVTGEISMIRFTQEAFVECLEEYYEMNGYDDGAEAIRYTARDACVTSRSIVITRGNEYTDWMDVDLFGGIGNGDKKKDFIDWCMREKGIKFIYCDSYGILSCLNKFVNTPSA